LPAQITFSQVITVFDLIARHTFVFNYTRIEVIIRPHDTVLYFFWLFTFDTRAFEIRLGPFAAVQANYFIRVDLSGVCVTNVALVFYLSACLVFGLVVDLNIWYCVLYSWQVITKTLKVNKN
jgi:hypothetical protein